MISPILASLSFFFKSSPPVDPARLALAAKSDRMFFWLVISSIVVGVGVILEAPGEFHELKRWLKLWRLNKTKSLFVPIAFLGLIIVTAGIVGEGIFEYLSSDAETAVRKYDEGVLTTAIEQAEKAKTSADDAAKDATKAKGDADDAVIKAATASSAADNASTVASTASESAKSVGTKADQLDTKLKEANTELAVLETKRKDTEAYLRNAAICTSPRTFWNHIIIGGPGGGTFADGLLGLRGFTVNIASINDPEAQTAVSELEEALAMAQVKSHRVELFFNENVAPGVTVESFSPANDQDHFPPFPDQPSQAAADALIRFLHSYNWQASWFDGSSAHTRDLTPTSIRVAIGRYPTPMLAPPPALEQLSARSAELDKQAKDMFMAEGDRLLAERLKGQSPEAAARMRAAHEKYKQEYPEQMERMLAMHGGSQPCKVMKMP